MSGGAVSNVTPIRLGLVGIGKIARDQHIPAINGNRDFTLAATASHDGALDGVPGHREIAGLIAGGHEVSAVTLCTPPLGRHILTRQAIDAGLHVMLEKPPGTTVSEVADLADHAARRGVTVFTAWHSREASAVDAARDWLAVRHVASVRIEWAEDICVWHPGQEWLLAAGGFGVFDPVINALSIVTAILPGTLRVASATLEIPANRAAPIAASLAMVLDDEVPVSAKCDFLRTGPQRWDITVETDEGTLTLHEGGRRLAIDGVTVRDGANTEYARLYRRFAALIAARESDVDFRPLRLVTDALSVGEIVSVAPFHF